MSTKLLRSDNRILEGKRVIPLVRQGSKRFTSATCRKEFISRNYKMIVFRIRMVTLYSAPQSVRSNTILTEVDAGDTPYAVAVNPETNIIYVANYNSATVTIIDGVRNSTINPLIASVV